MILERAFRLVHSLDIPEAKRRYWPQYSEVVVSRDGSIEDVFLFFDRPTEEQQIAALNMYPGCVLFPVTADKIHTTLDEFRAKVVSCAELAKRLIEPR